MDFPRFDHTLPDGWYRDKFGVTRRIGAATIVKTEYDAVVAEFTTHKDNTAAAIAKRLGMSFYRADRCISLYMAELKRITDQI